MSYVADGISEALGRHGIVHSVKDECITLTDNSLRFYIEVHDREVPRGSDMMIQLNVGTVAPALGDRIIWETFAGIGEDRRAAEGNALGKFLTCPFHVILSALAGRNYEDGGVKWASWQGASDRWRVCDSLLLLHGVDPASVPFQGPFERLRREFENDAAPGLHWVSVFFAFLNGALTGNDIQLDGAPWNAAQRVFEDWTFKAPKQYFSGRYFFVALPDDDRSRASAARS